MIKTKYISIFPYNVKEFYHNIVFDINKNKGQEALIFATLKNYLNERNIQVNTFDVETGNVPYQNVYFDLPYPWNVKVWKKIIFNKNTNILLCNEPPIINPFNYLKIFHYFFRKIYTTYDDIVDNKRYFKLCLPQSSVGVDTKPIKFKNKAFLVMVNANKLPFYPFQLLSAFGKELYSERIKAINFFERAIPDNFHLYGKGWNKRKKFNLTELIFGYRRYSTYQGEIKNKIKLLSNFKYSICFENLTNINGYITEKIFDCFKAKCVPVYWGAPNITKYIPKNCFIDYRDYGSYEKLLAYLKHVNENEYNAYIQNIEKLLADKKFCDTWFEDGFAKFFLRNIVDI